MKPIRPTHEKIALVVRADLPAGDQAVQAAHALTEFLVNHPEIAREWHKQSNTLALLSVPNEAALGHILDQAFDKDLRVASFREPDLGDSLTAIALEPAGRKLVRGLPLALGWL